MADSFRILLIEDDPSTRFLVRVGLELEGVEVIEAESLAHARALVDEPFEAVVLDRNLPDGAGDSLVGELLQRLPPSRVIVHSVDGAVEGLPAVRKGDVEAIARLLSLRDEASAHAGARGARRAIGRVHREWLNLCRWDPILAPGVHPPVAESVIRAVTAALERPQPLGWGLDPALEPVADVFGLNVGDVHTALAELVCLREAFSRVVITTVAESERSEATQRLHMIIDRTMLVVAQTAVRRLAEQALTDALTGLGNRRAFEQDLERELGRAARHGHLLTVAVLDVDGLKHVNDEQGHIAGDDLLRRLARAVRVATRAEDRGYRIGGDEFALILVDAVPPDADALTRRLLCAGAPPVTIGTASVPPDPPDDLVHLADARLYDRRRTPSPASGLLTAPQPDDRSS